MINQIIHGDCLDILMNEIYHPNKENDFNEESIDLTFTSPPYFNAREYSQYPTYEDYLKFLKKVFTWVWTVTKEGRFCVVNTSPVIEARQSRSHQSKRYPIPFDLNTIMQDIGWDFIDDIIWEKPEPSVKDRNAQFRNNRNPLTYKPNVVTEYIMVYRKKTDKLIDWNLKQYSKHQRTQDKVLGIKKDGFLIKEPDRTNIWKIPPKSSKLHPAIFPDELVERIIKYYSFRGDIVLDPFCGIGTTCRVAKSFLRNYIGIEQNYEYYCIAKNNLE